MIPDFLPVPRFVSGMPSGPSPPPLRREHHLERVRADGRGPGDGGGSQRGRRPPPRRTRPRHPQASRGSAPPPPMMGDHRWWGGGTHVYQGFLPTPMSQSGPNRRGCHFSVAVVNASAIPFGSICSQQIVGSFLNPQRFLEFILRPYGPTAPVVDTFILLLCCGHPLLPVYLTYQTEFRVPTTRTSPHRLLDTHSHDSPPPPVPPPLGRLPLIRQRASEPHRDHAGGHPHRPGPLHSPNAASTSPCSVGFKKLPKKEPGYHLPFRGCFQSQKKLLFLTFS